eukprot:6191029-Pleurochrysis_carterae.AAC.4
MQTRAQQRSHEVRVAEHAMRTDQCTKTCADADRRQPRTQIDGDCRAVARCCPRTRPAWRPAAHEMSVCSCIAAAPVNSRNAAAGAAGPILTQVASAAVAADLAIHGLRLHRTHRRGMRT